MIFVVVWIKFGSEKWSELLVTPILKPGYKVVKYTIGYQTRPGDLVMPDPFGHFWFDFGPYWTNLDIFGPFCLL